MAKGGWRTCQLQNSGYYWRQVANGTEGVMQVSTVYIRFCFILKEKKPTSLFIYFLMSLNPRWV